MKRFDGLRILSVDGWTDALGELSIGQGGREADPLLPAESQGPVAGIGYGNRPVLGGVDRHSIDIDCGMSVYDLGDDVRPGVGLDTYDRPILEVTLFAVSNKNL